MIIELIIKIVVEYGSYDVNDIISNHHRSHRKKRDFSSYRNDSDSNSNSYTIEVLVAVDESMRIFHMGIGSDITEYVLSLISTTTNIFADASIGNMIHIAIVGIVNLNGNLMAEPLKEGSLNHNKTHNKLKISNLLF